MFKTYQIKILPLKTVLNFFIVKLNFYWLDRSEKKISCQKEKKNSCQREKKSFLIVFHPSKMIYVLMREFMEAKVWLVFVHHWDDHFSARRFKLFLSSFLFYIATHVQFSSIEKRCPRESFNLRAKPFFDSLEWNL